MGIATWKQKTIKLIMRQLKSEFFYDLVSDNDYGDKKEARVTATDELYRISEQLYNSLKINGYLKDRGYK